MTGNESDACEQVSDYVCVWGEGVVWEGSCALETCASVGLVCVEVSRTWSGTCGAFGNGVSEIGSDDVADHAARPSPGLCLAL